MSDTIKLSIPDEIETALSFETTFFRETTEFQPSVTSHTSATEPLNTYLAYSFDFSLWYSESITFRIVMDSSEW